jgi:hypothetical protein
VQNEPAPELNYEQLPPDILPFLRVCKSHLLDRHALTTYLEPFLVAAKDADVDVVMRPGLATDAKVDRPPPRDPPGQSQLVS